MAVKIEKERGRVPNITPGNKSQAQRSHKRTGGQA
jgi:hypothetical protein